MSWRIESRALSILFVVCGAAHAAVAQPRRLLDDLGRVKPPGYAAPLLRTAEPSDVFDEAMAMYKRREFEPAADLLRRVVAVDPDDQAANFFLAVSLMMFDEVGEAEDRLTAVLVAPPSPFTVPAHFVRAKALVRLGRLDIAERELLIVIKSGTEYAQPAADLLPKVRAAKARR